MEGFISGPTDVLRILDKECKASLVKIVVPPHMALCEG